MSERKDSTCQKHDLPKSLQGTEDAEFVWGMIIDRFPNAAPLLCEMEAVIDRAEDLLQQLRTPPCREIETSTSFCTPDSEGSTMMISARESMFTDNDNVEENSSGRNVAETQVSQSTVCEEAIDVNNQDMIFKDQDVIFKDQEIRSQSSDLLTIYCSNEEKLSIAEEPAPSKVESNIGNMTKHARSLEEWSKAVDVALRGSHMGETQFNKRTTDHEKKFVDHNERKIEDSNTNDQRPCVILHRANVDGSTVLVSSELNMKNKELSDIKDDSVNVSPKINTAGSGDESTSEQRTPLRILEEYSKRCEVPVVYECVNDGPHRHKSNVYVIRGCLGGFTATCRGETEESTKNDLAAKILQMIANQQIKDEKFTTLAYLSKDEMMEIINLGMDSPRETAQRRLYQLCLEADEQLPKYCVNKVQTVQGFTYLATCTALGYTGEGRGYRECAAKKAAADELYHQYCQDRKAASKVQEIYGN